VTRIEAAEQSGRQNIFVCRCPITARDGNRKSRLTSNPSARSSLILLSTPPP
jgi:hypothetical protein